MRICVKIGFLLLVALFFLNHAKSQSYNKTRILFVLDGSYSMYGDLDKVSKISVAKDILKKMVDSLNNTEDVQVALRLYGHQKDKYKQDCQDTKLEVGFSKHNEDLIKDAIDEIDPMGTTPIAYSLSEASNDFPQGERYKNVIILLTDGIEECGGDPCAVSTALQENNVILKPFIIGLGISEKFKSQFDCVGRYYNAGDRKEFREVLSVVVSQAVNTTTTQVNLLDIYGAPTETDVNMTFYDTNQGIMRYNLYHTMKEPGHPDTLNIDPVTTYDIQVHTNPTVWKRNVGIEPGEHNDIPISTPMGKIRLKMDGKNYYQGFKTLVRKAESGKRVNEQPINSTQRYIVGKYDLEFLTRPKVKINNVEVKQDKQNRVEIPSPGRIYIRKSENMVGSVFHMSDNNLEWVCNISTRARKELIVLQPGKYRIIARREKSKEAHKTTETQFEVVSGASKVVSINY